MTTTTTRRAVARQTLFPDHQVIGEPHIGAVIDALMSEIGVALGIEAALRCPDLDGDFLIGVQEIAGVHVDRLRAIGRMVEQVRP